MEWKWESNYLYFKSNYRLTCGNEGWNLWHIGKETVGLIAAENCAMTTKTAQAWADKIIAEREGKMSEPWTKEQLERIKAVHDRETCETTRKVLKEIMGEGEAEWPRGTAVFMFHGVPYIQVSCAEGFSGDCPPYVMGVLHIGNRWSSPQQPDFYKKDGFRPMRPGTVLLTVGEGGEIKKSVVKED